MSSFDEYATFGVGGVRYPLAVDSPNELLQDADPALYWATEFLVAMLRRYVEPRLAAESEKHGLKLAAVRRVMAYEPAPNLIAHEDQFPLLALYRRTEVEGEHSLAIERDTSMWEYAYLLPHFEQERVHEHVSPILRSVGRVIKHAVRVGQDPSFRGGINVWQQAGITSARVQRTTYRGFARTTGYDAWYRAVVGQIEVIEQETPVRNAFPPLEGVRLDVDTHDEEGQEAIGLGGPDDVLAIVTFPPRVDFLTPANASATGGGQVYVYGANFRSGARVEIGGVACAAVVVLSPSLLSAIVPAHDPAPLVDVVVTNADETTGRKLRGFSFVTP